LLSWPGWPSGNRVELDAALRVITFALLLCPALALAQDLRITHRRRQGDSTLILGPTGIACLVDAGEVDTNQRLVPLLNSRRTQLKWMVISAPSLGPLRLVPEIVSAGFLPQTAVYDRARQPADRLAVQPVSVRDRHQAHHDDRPAPCSTSGEGDADLPLRQRAALAARRCGSGTSQEENSRSIALSSPSQLPGSALRDLTGAGSGSANVESIVAR